jgi:hypothetical protein
MNRKKKQLLINTWKREGVGIENLRLKSRATLGTFFCLEPLWPIELTDKKLTNGKEFVSDRQELNEVGRAKGVVGRENDTHTHTHALEVTDKRERKQEQK